MNASGYLRPLLNAVLGVAVVLLFWLTVWPVALEVARRYPLETLIIGGVVAVCAAAVILYIWELVIIGWIVDLLSTIGVPKFQGRPVPLECELVGEIIVVTLRDNISGVLQCQAVEKQLKHLLADRHCDFVLDFLYAGKISHRFREVMVHLVKAARRSAVKLGKPYRPVPLPRGSAFRVFEDRERAVEEMSKHEGHGWVVLCSVPVGIRAVS